jgi:NAD(P)-dependent dehydrogenase (short-subunit alcohol dehydrogenase family)
VNAAGVIRRDAGHNPAVFAEVIDINLTGAMRLCTTRGRCSSKSGCIVNVTSMLAYSGGARVPGTARAKGASAN